MNKTRQIIAIRLATILSSNYNYDLVQVEAVTGNILLTQANHPQYPYILILSNSIHDNLDRSEEMIHSISRFNRNNSNLKVLTFSFEDQNQIETYRDIVHLSQNNTFSDSSLQYFPKIDQLGWLITDVQLDLQRAVNSMNQASLRVKKAKEKHKFFSGSKGTITIILINIVMYILGIMISMIAQQPTTYMIALGGIYVPFIQGAYEIFRFILAGFVHASFAHLMFNLFSLYNLSLILEKVYGTKKFIFVLLMSIIGGNLFVYIGETQAVLSVGLSTGVYGLLGLTVVYLFETKLIRSPMLRNQLIWTLVINLMITLLPNISWLGHLGGFITGLSLGVVLSKKFSWATLRKNTLYASLIALVLAGYLAINRPKPTEFYLGSDMDVISVWRKVGFNWYADYLEESLSKYYFLGEQL